MIGELGGDTEEGVNCVIGEEGPPVAVALGDVRHVLPPPLPDPACDDVGLLGLFTGPEETVGVVHAALVVAAVGVDGPAAEPPNTIVVFKSHPGTTSPDNAAKNGEGNKIPFCAHCSICVASKTVVKSSTWISVSQQYVPS